jgi:hypothetical protein
LAQLSAQVDEIAGLVAEGRTDLSPIEARLNRMSRTAAQAPPIDLAELYGRLDELAEAVSQHVPVDITPDPTWSTALQRLERLLPALEGLRAGGPLRGEPPGSLQDRRELLERFDQLGQQLGEQLEALRRRIALRARPAGQGLDDETIAAIADAVVARLNEATPRRASMLPASSAPALTRPGPSAVADIAPERPPRGRDSWRNT